MAVSFKAVEISAQLKDQLAIRLGTTLAITQSFDTDGYPIIYVGPGTNGGANALIKILAQPWPLFTDVLGIAQNVFTPHILQLATEANPVGGAGADPLSTVNLLAILGSCLSVGCHLDWYQSASGTAPVIGSVIAGNLKASFESDVYHQLVSNQ